MLFQCLDVYMYVLHIPLRSINRVSEVLGTLGPFLFLCALHGLMIFCNRPSSPLFTVKEVRVL